MTKDTTAGGVEAVARAIYEGMGYAYSGKTVMASGEPYGAWATAVKCADRVLALTPPATGDGAGVGPESLAMRALRLVAEHRSAMAKLEPDAHDAVMAALAASPAPAPAAGVEMPQEPDDLITDAIRKAWRETRTSSICGMTIEAQWRSEFARELAVYRAIRETLLASPKAGETGNG